MNTSVYWLDKLWTIASVADDTNTGAIALNRASNASIHLYINNTDGLSGTVSIQGSNIDPSSTASPTSDAARWVNISFGDANGNPTGSFVITSGSSMTKIFDLQGVGFEWARVSFQHNSGTGSANLWQSVKR